MKNPKELSENASLVLKDLDKRDLFLIAFFSGLVFIMCSLYLSFIIPVEPFTSNHSNLNSTILALELIKNKEELINLIGTEADPKNQLYSDSFIKSLDIDYFYILLYSLYFFILFEIGIRYVNLSAKLQILFYSILILCIAFDISENVKLLSVLTATSPSQIEESILNLRIISLCKWSMVFLLSGSIGVLFWLSVDGMLVKITGLCLFTSFVTSIPGLFRFSLLEIASYFMVVGLFISWIFITQKNYDFFFRK